MATSDREFFQNIGICPVCRKRKLIGDEKECLNCRTIKYSKNRKWVNEHPNYHSEWRMNKYNERSKNHQCTYCGTPLDDDYKFKMCPKCLNKSKLTLQRSRARRGI